MAAERLASVARNRSSVGLVEVVVAVEVEDVAEGAGRWWKFT